ncbi:MAG TPA: C4-type zinc ribbon domain-containing protein, partial [Saprospiraceae bacterium]|nr:C4-type zinc ribbon domain-containing protein [Saprospiraceae bacterium]
EALDTILAKLGSRSKDADNKKVELSKIIEKTEKEEAKLLKESDKARKEIDERLLTSYDKIRKTYRNGLAVVTVARGACGGCFNRIPPQLIIEIGVMKKIIACEHCGRVLIDEAILEGHEA